MDITKKTFANSTKQILYPSRMLAVQCIYSIYLLNKKKEIDTIASEYIEYQMGKYPSENLNKKFFLDLVYYTSNNKDTIDKLIENNIADNWKFERLASLITAILRTAISDIKITQTQNLAIIINDYLQISKSLNHSKETGFINSILDKVSQTN